MDTSTQAHAASITPTQTMAEAVFDYNKFGIQSSYVNAQVAELVTRELFDLNPMHRLGLGDRIDSVIKQIEAIEVPEVVLAARTATPKQHVREALTEFKRHIQKSLFQLHGHEQMQQRGINGFNWIRDNVDGGKDILDEVNDILGDVGIIGYHRDAGATLENAVGIVERKYTMKAPKSEAAFEATK